MYLSRLRLNLSNRNVRRDVANIYEAHRTILRAFPDTSDGGPGRVLFRIEPPEADGTVPVIVQSDKEPQWKRLEDLSGYTASPVETKQFSLNLHQGQRLAFRLLANPTVKRDKKRYGLLREHEQKAWLERKASGGGFRIIGVTIRNPDTVSGKKNIETPLSVKFIAVLFDGILEVENPDIFISTIKKGIGSAKGFGFGLLSVAPVELFYE